jgi:hypothetical protein
MKTILRFIQLLGTAAAALVVAVAADACILYLVVALRKRFLEADGDATQDMGFAFIVGPLAVVMLVVLLPCAWSIVVHLSRRVRARLILRRRHA